MTGTDKFNLTGRGKRPESSDLASRVSSLQPASDASVEVAAEAIARQAAAKTGFTSREGGSTGGQAGGPASVSYTIPRRQRRPVEPTHPLNMRPPVRIVERYIALAESLRMSYPQLIEHLLDQYDRNPG